MLAIPVDHSGSGGVIRPELGKVLLLPSSMLFEILLSLSGSTFVSWGLALQSSLSYELSRQWPTVNAADTETRGMNTRPKKTPTFRLMS